MNCMKKNIKMLIFILFVGITDCFSIVRFNKDNHLLKGTIKEGIPVLTCKKSVITKGFLLKNGFNIKKNRLYFLGEPVTVGELLDIVNDMLNTPISINSDGFLYHLIKSKPILTKKILTKKKEYEYKYKNMDVFSFLYSIDGKKISIDDLEKYGLKSLNGRLVRDKIFYNADQARSLTYSIDLPRLITEKISELTELIFNLDFYISEQIKKSSLSYVFNKNDIYQDELKKIINLSSEITTFLNKFISAEITIAKLFGKETNADYIYNVFSRLQEIHDLFRSSNNMLDIALEDKKALLKKAYNYLVFTKNYILSLLSKPIDQFLCSDFNLNYIRRFLNNNGVKYSIKFLEGTVVAGSIYILTVFESTDLEIDTVKKTMLFLVNSGIIYNESSKLIRK